MASSLYVGLMSGTSMDGIDTALVEFGDRQCTVRESRTSDYPAVLRTELLAAKHDPASCSLDAIGSLDRKVGECFRDAVLELLSTCDVLPSDVAAIGSHGQTLRHQPEAETPFTIQIGDPSVIALGTGITTVADFRREDMAAGGQGAPLAPAFHAWLFNDLDSDIVVLNIGGIANITILPAASGAITGFDTGPGNTLLDLWIQDNRGEQYDAGGAWAAQGNVLSHLLDEFLADDYFEKPPPKSTGFEHFNAEWLQSAVANSCTGREPATADVQSTLAALTTNSIASAVGTYAPETSSILVCGGGVHNADLMRRLAEALPDTHVDSTRSRGLCPDSVEAAAFAWLAKQRLAGEPGNLPSVTGAARAVPLGAVYLSGT